SSHVVLPPLFPDSRSELYRSGAARKLRNPENHEFRRARRRDTDHHDEPAVVDIVVSHRGAVDLDEERFFFSGSEERALSPLRAQKLGDGLLDSRPQPIVVWLEDHPLRATEDRGLDEDEETPHVYVLPQRVVRKRARTPDATTTTRKCTDRVDASWIEDLLSAVRHFKLELERATHDFVGRRLEHAAFNVG